jgi:hypothetical protein
MYSGPASLTLLVEALAPAHINPIFRGWSIPTQLEERKLSLEALIDPDLLTSCQKVSFKSIETGKDIALLRLTMSMASAGLARLDHITNTPYGQEISVKWETRSIR